MIANTTTADPFAPFLATLADGGDPARFSDWLQDEFPCEPWAHAWAEFVRASCRADFLKSKEGGAHANHTEASKNCHLCHEVETMGSRRAKLLSRHGAEWAWLVLGPIWPEASFGISDADAGHMWIGAKDKSNADACATQAFWGVALPETFKFPTLAGFMGEKCRECGDGVHRGMDGGVYNCPACIWGTTSPPVGPALACRVPLRRVEFSDKRPWGSEASHWSWWPHSTTGEYRPLYRVPVEFEAELAYKVYLTEAAARDALSDAAIRWAATATKGATTR